MLREPLTDFNLSQLTTTSRRRLHVLNFEELTQLIILIRTHSLTFHAKTSISAPHDTKPTRPKLD